MKQIKTEARGKNKEYRPTTKQKTLSESYVIRLLIVVLSKLFLAEGMSVPAPSLTASAA